MKFISKWYKKSLLLLLLMSLLPNFAFAQDCSRNGYTISTINGIFTKESDAIKNKDDLIRFLPDSYNGENIIVNYLYNPTHGGGLGDIFDYVKQGFFDQKSDYDLTEILQDASSKITTQKLLLVAHSQGNFYANNFYDKVAGIEGGVPVESIGVYGIASPANHVAGGGKYLTSDTDTVIGKVRETLKREVLPSNAHIGLQVNDEKNGHSFSDIYLKYESARIVSDIKKSLDKLQNNNIQIENMPCINPPEITLGHKIQKGILVAIDPFASATTYVLGGVYNAASVVRDTGSNAIAWIYNTSKSIASSVFKFTKSNLASVADSVSENSENINVGLGNLDFSDINKNIEIENLSNENTEIINTVNTPTVVNQELEKEVNTDIVNKDTEEKLIHHSGGGSGASTVNAEENTIETPEPVTPKDESTELPTEEIPSTETEVIEPVILGNKINFDSQDKIYYSGDFMLCDVVDKTLFMNGNNSGMNFISSTNWQKPYMSTVNESMTPNKNYRFIFGDYEKSVADCSNSTFINDYSNTFYYATNKGDSIVYDENTLNRILSFEFKSIATAQVVMHDGGVNKISVYVPSGTDLTNLIPTISISDKATIDPQSEITKDYTNPVIYKVAAFDGSIQEYTVTVYPTLGEEIDFDAQNKINYSGNFIFCDVDTSTVSASGEVLGFISSTNWQTPYMSTVNESMTPNKNYRFIFGSYSKSNPDCTDNTFVNNYSHNFYYANNLGSSVVYGVYTAPVEEEPDPVIEPDPIPDPVIEPDPIPDPDPVIDPIPDPDPIILPDTTPPNIESYAFNNTVGNITVNPVENPMTFTLNANENVDWVSVRIEKQDDDNVYKTFFSGNGCVDFTKICTKTWSDTSKGLLASGVYRIKVNIKDATGNVYQDYLAPYVINVDMTLPKN